MKVVFIGGGAHRYLPVARSILADGDILHGGEIVLYDLNAARAAAMAQMIRKTPEFPASGCRITHDAPLDAALDGADVVNVVLMAGTPLNFERLRSACHDLGFIGSDQLSPSGAMLALKGGPILMDLARRMERLCPQAWLVDFANPVAVLSAAVNNHTKIRCLGVCAGHQNHLWDISRLLGRDERQSDAQVHCVGVNHMSFILPGSRWRGADLYEQIEARLSQGPWQPPAFGPLWSDKARYHIEQGLRALIRLYRRYGYLIFSTELDGMASMDISALYKPRAAALAGQTLEQMRAAVAAEQASRAQAEAHFHALLAADLSDADWHEPDPRHRYLLRDDEDLMAMLIRARAGRTLRLAASAPNRGAVADLPDRLVLEYTQSVGPDGARPAGRYAVPAALYGWVASFAMHQTLLGDAVATQDPRRLFEAISCYPVDRDTPHFWKMWRQMLDIAAEEIPHPFTRTLDYLPHHP